MFYYATVVQNNTNQEVCLQGKGYGRVDNKLYLLGNPIIIPANEMVLVRSDELAEKSHCEEEAMFLSISIDGKRCKQIIVAGLFKTTRELVFTMVKTKGKISHAYTRYRGSWYSFPRLRMFIKFRNVFGGKVLCRKVHLTIIPSNI